MILSENFQHFTHNIQPNFMKRSFRSSFLVLVGLFAGLALATILIRTEIQVDYDSGAVREVLSLGPINIREARYGGSYFGSIRMPNGNSALTGLEDWHVAQSFKGNSKMSPLLAAGQVLNDISRLEQLPWGNSTIGLSEVKRRYLESLSQSGIYEASEIARISEQHLIGELDTPANTIAVP